jgi:hypothetical protein
LILVYTGPLVALFDPADAYHARFVRVLKSIEEPIGTATTVLTEAFHLLSPDGVGSQRFMDFIAEAGLTVWFLDDQTLCFLRQYFPSILAVESLKLSLSTLRSTATPSRSCSSSRIKRGHYLTLHLCPIGFERW